MGPVNTMSLLARSAIGDIESAPSTFSSWDKCMQKAYCKWPAIVGIIVGSLIILSIVGCLVSCLCCGVQCCKGCCGCCYDCCGSSNRGKRSKYADPPAPYYQQPPPPANMHYGHQQPAALPAAPPAYRGPQTATFDHPTTKVDEDALPAMPTWADASTRRVENSSPVHEEVEMNRLDMPDPHGTAGMVPIAGGLSRGGYSELPAASPLATSPQSMHNNDYRNEPEYFPPSRSPGPRSPRLRSPGPQALGYGPQAGYGSQAAAFGAGTSPAPYRGFENPVPVRTPNFHTPRPYDARRSPTSLTSPPATQPAYSPYERQPPQQQTYQAFSPSIPSTPPPPFSDVVHETNDRPPSLLQAGRRPVANSWRNV